MNEVINPDILELIRQTSTSDSNDINEKIRTIIGDLIQATDIGQKVYTMYENLSNEKNASDERIRQYAIITVNALKELSEIQARHKQIKNDTFDDKIIRNNSTDAESRFQFLLNQFANDAFNKIQSLELKMSNISNFFHKAKSQIDNLNLSLSRISTTLSCSPNETLDRIISLQNDNSNCRQMLTLIIQNMNGQNNNFQSLDFLLEQIGIPNSNIQLRLSQFLQSVQQIKEISNTLNTDSHNIINEINKLIEISKDSSKVLDSVPQIKEISEILHVSPQNIKSELNKLIKISSDYPKHYESTQYINEISEILHTDSQNIKSELNRLIKISNDSTKLYESTTQINEISSILNTNPQNIKKELHELIKISNDSKNLYESAQQLKDISEILHTNPQNIKNEINKLIKISEEKSKPKPLPQIVDTSGLENEIARLKRENQFLIETKQKLSSEKEGLIQRIAIQESQFAPKQNSTRLTYTRYDYLATIPPVPSSNQNFYNSSTSYQEEFEESLKSKNNTITQLNYQLQDALKSLNDMQENKSKEINSLRDQITHLKIENNKKESKSINQQKEISELKVKISSLPQSELFKRLSSFFGGCSSEDEIINKVFNMKNDILKLKLQVSAKEMKASNLNSVHQNSEGFENGESASELKRQINQITDQAMSLQDQISELKSNNNHLIDDNNTLNQQIQAFRENETSMKNEISGYQRKIREANRTCERLKAEFDISNNQLSEIKDKYQLFESESEKLLTSINKFTSKIASKQTQKGKKKQNGSRVPNEAVINLQKMCEALQIVFMQYTMSDFSTSEKVISDLLYSIEQVSNSGGLNQNQNALTNEIMNNIIQNKVSSFVAMLNKKMNTIDQQIRALHEQFNNSRNEIIQIIGDQQRDLQDYIENDYAVPYASLKASFKKLQEKFDAVTKNMSASQNINDQFGQFEFQQVQANNAPRQKFQSRFQQSTPPRNASRGSRSSIQSPSETILDRTIQQNYDRIRFNP